MKKRDIFLLIAVSVAALLLRLYFFSFVSMDYTYFLKDWFATLEQNGGWRALGLPVGNYTAPYIYIIAALTYLPVNSLYSIKLVSCLADFVLAFFAMKLVMHQTQKKSYGIAAYCAVLFLPTVVLNSAAWGQCDSIYVAALLASLYYTLCEKPKTAVFCFAISFIFKLQAIFFAPFLFALFLKKRIKFTHFFIVPAVYLLSILPAALMGRSVWELLTVYLSQSSQYKTLTMNAPSVFAWLQHIPISKEALSIVGIAVAAVFVFAALLFICKQKFSFHSDLMLSFALTFALLLPFCLPHMHERYFYLADILSVVYVFYFRKKFYLPLLIVGSSLYTACRYLYGVHFLNLETVAAAICIALLLLAWDAVRRTRKAGKIAQCSEAAS